MPYECGLDAYDKTLSNASFGCEWTLATLTQWNLRSYTAHMRKTL